MECNRDEAIRAKEIAEKKMQNNDFDGARKIARKAQQLYSDLENITQLLAVCDVHCSAKLRTLGTEKDWYGILQFDGKVDEVTIKKQYRKLALLLHPDKNQFPGAEAAFKLIGEANLVLSDSGKKAVYDSKIGAWSKYSQAKIPPYQVNKIPTAGKKNGVHESKANGDFTRLNVQKSQQAAQFNATSTSMQQHFWTSCSFCKVNYQYRIQHMNTEVTCQHCKKAFIAFVTGAPRGSNWTRTVPQGVSVPPRSTYQTQAASQGLSSGFNNQLHVSNHGIPSKFHNQNQGAFQGIPTAANTRQPSVSHATYKTAQENAGFKPLHSRSPPNLGGAGLNGVAAPKVRHVKPVEDRGNNKRKGKRKLDAEPSESFSSLSSSDLDEVISDDAAAHSDVLYERRRSSRQKHNISYVEPKVDDDDFGSPLKRSRKGKSFFGNEVPQEAADSSPEGNGPFCKHDIGGKYSDELNDGALGAESIDDSDSGSRFEDGESEIHQYPDPEFYDFNKDREENCFRVNQFWACFDDKDGMPRFYAQIKKVCYNPFKLSISWLEFIQPNNHFVRTWCKMELPVACGNYRRGSLDTGNLNIFSHQIECEAGRRKDSFRIYPRSGEIWALFRDWNTGWVTDSPEKYAYDIVEVVSEFTDDDGIQVMSLEKVNGFTLLYHCNTGCKIFSILPKEMLRFSHKIPSYKLKGGEKEGVPAGSFELDGASVASNEEADPNDSEVPKSTCKKSGENDPLVLERSPKTTVGKGTNVISSPSKKEASLGTNGKTSCALSTSEADLVSEEINGQLPDQSTRRSRRVHA